MIRTKKAKQVLTKAEQKHLTRDANIHSLAAMKLQVEFMIKTDQNKPHTVCRECWHIARKLDLL